MKLPCNHRVKIESNVQESHGSGMEVNVSLWVLSLSAWQIETESKTNLSTALLSACLNSLEVPEHDIS